MEFIRLLYFTIASFSTELYSFWQYSIDKASKESLKLSPSDSSDVAVAFVSLQSRTDHTFLIGFRSCVLAGHWSTLMLQFLSHSFCLVARSVILF